MKSFLQEVSLGLSKKNKKLSSKWFYDFHGSKIFEQIGASVEVDKRLFEEDIIGSIVHSQMLVKQKIIDKKIAIFFIF